MAFRPYKILWGGAVALLHRSRRIDWIDILLILAFLGLVYGVIGLAQRWTGQLRPAIEIDLSPSALPKYTLFSLSRGLIAYGLSLAFTLVYGYWAAHDSAARRILIPLLDILQSIPVLGFMPGLIIALAALFPHSNFGLELASVIMIFTGQVWNMTFSFYHSLRSVPKDQLEAAAIYGFNWRQRLRWVELPFSTMSLVWNSMMSMAGGWFFLMINEAFVLGNHDFRLPGLGSYMSVAVARGDGHAMILAILSMILMIVFLDQILWRPVVAWAQKFKVEEGGQGEQVSSWFLNWLRRSQLLRWLEEAGEKFRSFVKSGKGGKKLVPVTNGGMKPKTTHRVSLLLIAVMVIAMILGAWRLFHILAGESLQGWVRVTMDGGMTLGRVLMSTIAGTIWALPLGLGIGLSPRASRLFQPVVQILASFPAPMLFPAVIALLALLKISLGWGSIVLMLLGTQWYILFNVIAGAMAIPADLREAARSFQIAGWRKFTKIYFPAVFPYLVTGWVTAAGGAWNASIVAEFVTYKGRVMATSGLGARISQAAASANFPDLAASILIMSIFVVTFNRSVWRRLYLMAEERFSVGT
ncbi:ABC-type anion transport protein [Candidatus Zixiibacteriota bacterium]|nr:ABC-type anion transport protein [candidate division Zixibacteria bacterium]